MSTITRWPLWQTSLALTAVVVVLVGLAWAAGTLAGALRRRPGRGSLARQRQQSPVWATPHDVKPLLCPDPDPRRMRLAVIGTGRRSRMLRTPLYRSLTVLALSGAGKTPRVVVPIVLDHQGPAVVASVKSDVLALTRHHRETLGPVWVFDPSQSTGTTATWSPLTHITSWADALDAARWVQESSKADTRGVQDAGFWESQSRFLLAPLLLLTAHHHGSMADINTLLEGSTTTEREVTTALEQIGDPHALTYWRQFCSSMAPQTRASVLTTARTVLEAWSHPRVRDAVTVRPGSSNLIDLDAVLNGRGTLYLVAPAAEQNAFSAIYECLVQAILMKVERTAQTTGLPLPQPLLLMLDEAANIAPLRNLDAVASKGSGEGLLVVTVWQDSGQINKIYGPDRARTVLSNHYAKTYLPGINDEATLRHLSDLIGQASFTRTSTTHSRQGPSTTITEQEARVAPVEWLRTMPPDQAIVIAGPYPPILGRVPAWYEDPRLRALIDPAVADRFDRMFTPTKESTTKGTTR